MIWKCHGNGVLSTLWQLYFQKAAPCEVLSQLQLWTFLLLNILPRLWVIVQIHTALSDSVIMAWLLAELIMMNGNYKMMKSVYTLKNGKRGVSIFEKHGTCYSELWQLPYWKPAFQLIIDPMHGYFKNLLMVHFWWTMQLTSTDTSVPAPLDLAFLYNFETIDEIILYLMAWIMQTSSKLTPFISYSQRGYEVRLMKLDSLYFGNN